MSYPSIEDSRLCASVVKEVVQVRGLIEDAAAIGSLTVTVARLFNRGHRDRETLLAEALRVELPLQPSEN